MHRKDLRSIESLGKHFHFDNVFWENPIQCGFLDLYQIGELCCERGFQINEHEQSVYEITYVISGCGYSYVDGKKIRLTEGDVMVNAMGHRHALEADEANLFRYTYIGFRFNENALVSGLNKLIEYYDSAPYHLVKDKNNILFPFMRCIDELYAQTAYGHFMVQNYCEQIVLLAARDSLNHKESLIERYSYQGTVSSAVYSVIRYVEENICTIGSIQELAKELGYNYTYLSHFFKDKTGTTLQKYISYKKIERAIQLLKYGELSVTQIGTQLNYENLQTFSKAFRRIMGITPTKYIELERKMDQQEKTQFPPNPLFTARE